MIFLEQGMSALLDSKSQSPLSLALPKGPRGVVRTLLEQADLDSDKASHGDHTSSQPPAQPWDEFIVEMQPKSNDPNTGFSGFNSQPQPPPAAHDEEAGLLDRQDSISESANYRPQPNCPGGPDLFPSDSERSPIAEEKRAPTLATPDRSSRLSSTGVLFLLFLFVFSLLSFTPFLPR